MNKSNKMNADLLGVSWGAACNRLRKKVLFSLIVRLKENSCHRCDGEILSVDDLSIEHKNAWRQAVDPVESFFDLNNIAFSHLSCNISAGDRPTKKYYTKEEQRLGKNKNKRKSWHSLGKDEQQKKRREKYLRYNC